MVAIGNSVSMINTMSLILGSLRGSNDSLQLQSKSEMKNSGGYGGGSCCCDPCCLDPPDVCPDPFEGIGTEDTTLSILVNLQWPRRDINWYLRGTKILIMRNDRKKREVRQYNPWPPVDSTTTTPSPTTTTTAPTTTTTAPTTTTTAPTTTTTAPTTTTTAPTTTTTAPTTTTTAPTTTTTAPTTTTTAPTTTTTAPTTTTTAPTTTTTAPTTTTTAPPTTTTAPTTTTTAPTTTTTAPTTTTTAPTTTTTAPTTTTTATTTTTTSPTTTSTTTSTTTTTTSTTTSPTTTSTTTSPTTTTETTTSPTTTTETTATATTTKPPKNPPPGYGGSEFTEDDLNDCLEFLGEEWTELMRLTMENTTQQQIESFAEGEAILDTVLTELQDLADQNITFDDPASLAHQTAFRRTSNISIEINKGGIIFESATQSFVSRFSSRISKRFIIFIGCIPITIDCQERFLNVQRFRSYPCPNSQYRRQDGSCNNLAVNILWGASFTPYRRDLPASYQNGISTIRKSVINNEDLPSARVVSTTINKAPSEESPTFSILHMTFGQFLDHDLIATPISKGYYGGPVRCCRNPSSFNCLPIDVPENDPFYSCYNVRCLEFIRSASFFEECRLGVRQQGNEQTGYLDASVIYGARDSQTNSLRTFECGLLKTQLTMDGQILLPPSKNLRDGCNRRGEFNQGRYCFIGGDGRANEQPLLTFFQTLWAREHNRVAKKLKECHDDWNDEKLFQEARRIVWAQLQQVTYGEYLPTILGPTLMASSKLNPLKGDDFTTDYNPFVDASIANNFATAAYRFGHSLIADNLLSVTKYGKTSPKELSTQFFNPFAFYQKHGISEYARGGLHLPEMKMDSYFTDEVTGKLFRSGRPFGLDLLALNIQRGRDHGLAPYVDWINYCGGDLPTDFDDLLPYMTQERIDALMDVYDDVRDVDLYVGGVSETPEPGALVGFTFTCLIHNQFVRMKYGDRYWFEYKYSPYPFTPAQLKQLHRVTLARIMCDNIPELEYIQRWPLKNLGPDNPKVCCESIRKYSLKPWYPDCHDDDDDCDHDDDEDHHEDCCCKKRKKKNNW